MVFYKIEATRDMPKKENELSLNEKRAICCSLAERSENFFQKSMGQSLIATVSIADDTAVFVSIAKKADIIKTEFENYIKAPVFQITSYKMEEITFASLKSLLSSADRNSYIIDYDEILDRFEIGELNVYHHNFDFGEAIIDDKQSLQESKNVAKSILFEETMLPELDRISKDNRAIKSIGHPVHYMITVDDRDIRKTIYKTLLSTLYNSGRIKNKRYSFVDFNDESRYPGSVFDTLYRSSDGGAVVIRYTETDEDEGQFARRSSDVIAAICEVAMNYKNNVLTIICIPKAANKIKENFLINCHSTALIELYEDIAFGTVAEDYLKQKARNNKVRSDKKLLMAIEKEKGYTVAELNRIFDDWYDKKLRNEIYPQYKTSEPVKAKIKNATPKGKAYEELQELIGLSAAKEVMNKALNYFKVQKLFADKGLKDERPSMHMVFTGNPGTAKTTVARLFAQIMKENGLIENGDLYEVGRADLVGKYVGSTAPLVKTAFKRAKGGVLFIDEAYSLVDDRDGLYGDEAINTIVQEMENNRQDTVVIFAGYPDEMESFLNKNPGLRSRIAFHIPFEDYNTQELCDIAKLIAKDKGFKLSDDAMDKLEAVFSVAINQSDFGNGRYARNVIEKAKMAQASRLINLELDSINNEDIVTINADDIESPTIKKEEKLIKIGFCL